MTEAEMQAAIAEKDREVTRLTNDVMTHKKGFISVKTFLESKGFDVNKDLEDQWEATSGKTKTENEKLTKAQEKQQKQIDELLTKLAEADNEKTENKIRSTLQDMMKDVIASEETIDNWITKKRVKVEDGKLFHIVDGKDVPIETSVAAFKKNNPDRIKVSQNGGGGSHASTDTTPNATEEISKSAYNKLSLSAQKDFFDKGGKLKPD